jgi:ribosomal protein S18 acetylase RimI-like enzyme
MTYEGDLSKVQAGGQSRASAKGESIRDRITIRQLEPKDSIRELTDLLHCAFKLDGQHSYAYPAAKQSEEETRMQIANGECLVAELDGRLIGIGMIWPPRLVAQQRWCCFHRSAHLRQLAVHPGFQGLGIGTKLLEYCEQSAIRMGAWELAGIAPIGSRQINLYRRANFKLIEYIVREDTNYDSVLFSKWLQKDRKYRIIFHIMRSIRLCDTFVAYKLGILGHRRHVVTAILHGLRFWRIRRDCGNSTGK